MKPDGKLAIQMIRKCLNNEISDEELSKWAFDGWYYYMEGKGKNMTPPKILMDVLLDIDAQWEIITSQKKDKPGIPKTWLEEWLKKLGNIKKVN